MDQIKKKSWEAKKVVKAFSCPCNSILDTSKKKKGLNIFLMFKFGPQNFDCLKSMKFHLTLINQAINRAVKYFFNIMQFSNLDN
jgi:hypothetical protein